MPNPSKKNLFLFVELLIILLSFPYQSKAANGTNYYVDSVGGSDTNSGISESQPWRTLAPVQARNFQPGDVIHLKRGSSWTGQLAINDSGTQDNPITFTVYGTGNKPVLNNSDGWNAISINTDWIVLEGIFVQGAQEAGIAIAGGADHNIVRNCQVTDTGGGIWIRGQYNLVTGNYIHDLHLVNNTPGGDDDYGAVCIWFYNSNNEVSYNRVERCIAPSYDYGTDGGCFEWWRSIDNCYLHHNWGEDCNGGFEISGWGGTDTLRNNVVAYNVFVNLGKDSLMGVHKGGTWGVNLENFRLENNTIVETKNTRDIISFWNGDPQPGEVIFRNNIVYSTTNQRVCNKSGFQHSHNLYYMTQGSVGFPLGEGEIIADPHLVDFANKDFHLQANSPAIDAGINLGYSLDYDDQLVPVGAAPDLGAFEYGGAPGPSPTPTPTPGLSPTPTPTPGVLPGLSWEAEEGIITSPFFVTSGYVSQSTTNISDPSLGGRASYRFNLPFAGDYVIQAWVDAPDDSTNSFFVNIDGEPASPSMIWDIYPWPTNGFVERTVSWRGGGTSDNNQFIPKVFNLSPGEHELIIRGREANTKLDKLSIVLAFPLSSGWNEILWPAVAGKRASDIPPECPIAVTKENFWFRPYVKTYGGLNFDFESGKIYDLKCNQEVVWNL